MLQGKWTPVEYYFKLKNFDFNKYKPWKRLQFLLLYFF
jgi:hypothetical protein